MLDYDWTIVNIIKLVCGLDDILLIASNEQESLLAALVMPMVIGQGPSLEYKHCQYSPGLTPVRDTDLSDWC